MKKRLVVSILLIAVIMLTSCGGSKNTEQDRTDENSINAEQEQIPDREAVTTEQAEQTGQSEAVSETQSGQTDVEKAVEEELGESEEKWNVADSVQEEESLGNPRSSYGLGSAPYLQGRNVLVSMFVTTPESTWTEEEKQQMLKKIETAAAYIEGAARNYEVETEIICDFEKYPELYAEATTDFYINEETDFLDRLDEEIARWFAESIDYDMLSETFDADGIATMVFVNNPGISYAIVYDGTDNVKESLVLFSKDYYNGGRAEMPITYAHEILHIFGAHDLYEEAEFTSEVTEYVEQTYPREIMLTVTLSGNSADVIDADVSPITAYHLGWVDEIEETILFPQLNRE